MGYETIDWPGNGDGVSKQSGRWQDSSRDTVKVRVGAHTTYYLLVSERKSGGINVRNSKRV